MVMYIFNCMIWREVVHNGINQSVIATVIQEKSINCIVYSLENIDNNQSGIQRDS